MGADWARVNDLFHRALAEPPDRRGAFLAGACADDPVLLADVTSLLSAHDRAGDFIEQPLARPPARVEPAVPPAPPLVGATIAHYAIRQVLGEGGMGVVYLAEDTRLGRLVALKALAPRFTGDAARRERLRREARAAAALTHSGIATVYALEEVGDELYIASEYVPGHTLREELGQGPLPIARVLDTGLSLARALASAHDRGLIHRDIKPENIIRSPGGEVKILDFGLARFRDVAEPLTRLTEAGAILGTPAYMAPEQIRGEATDFRADLFSLGVVLYELASGAHPLAAPDAASTLARILESQPAPLVDRLNQSDRHDHPERDAPGVRDLDAIVMTCLQKTPDARYPSTHALVHALERARQALVDGEAPAPARPASPRPAPASAAQWWWMFHQAAATVAYGALLYPLWWVREATPGPMGIALLLAGLVAAVGAGTLRLHLWFTLRLTPSEWRGERARTWQWIRGADLLFVAVLLAAAGLAVTAHASVAALLVASAVTVLVACTIIEPATTRAAFRAV